MGVPELWGVITSLSTLAALAGWVYQWRMYRGLADEAGVFLSELITYLDADGEDRVLVTEPESVLAATARLWDRWKESLAG